MWMQDQGIELRYLIRDNDKKFTAQFDRFINDIAKEKKGKVIKTSIIAPDMNAYAESFIGSLKRECLSHFFCVSLNQIDYIVRNYLIYYNHHRPHQGKDIGNRVLDKNFTPKKQGHIQYQSFFRGLLKSYYRQAA